MAKAPCKTTAKAVAKTAPEPTSSIELEPAKLQSYIWHYTERAGFTFARFWWDGEGPREGITPWAHQKMQPGDDPRFGAAAKVEVLLPPNATSDYTSADFLLRRFDETLPPFERHAMAHAKIVLDPDEPWHIGYERVRGYARSHFARRFPVILVAHVPTTAGLAGNGSHVHCIVLARARNINGFTGACYRLCSDTGYQEGLAAWQAWAAGEEARA